jgi:uncharacterized HAD superfamily protein
VAIRQTIEWLDRHDFPYWDLCFMQDKAAVVADLYIEDSYTNIKTLRAARKRVIAFETSQNRDRLEADDDLRASNWKEVEGLVLREIALWETRGEGAAQSLSGEIVSPTLYRDDEANQ